MRQPLLTVLNTLAGLPRRVSVNSSCTVFKDLSCRTKMNFQPLSSQILKALSYGYRPPASMRTGKRGYCFFSFAAGRRKALRSQSCLFGSYFYKTMNITYIANIY